MTDTDVLAALNDTQVLALTMFGEARGDVAEGGSSVEERVAVGCVIRNRLRTPRRYGHSYAEVCLRPLQFSCWNATDPNRALLMEPAYRMATKQPLMDGLLEETLYLADGIARGVVLDQVRGATLYLTTALFKSDKRPSWASAVSPVRAVGRQVFFTEN